MSFKQGDIVIVNLDPTVGHEQSGQRPVLVVSKDLYNTNTRQIVVCPITAKAKPLPMRILLDERTKTQGYIMCDQIRTLDAIARKPRFAESLPGDILETVKQTTSAIIL
ncbi:MAG: type II toxin-antitoxin system PemK/MazF family toxin [Defluviitaleaceae bacterium]|nr:type II toxin-antitoxin system PemK/MazF family toxin [Defluviitaleaceae bacterium]MCL2239733.1 type II toxin-antitoxin system PemK/MazF family toxin [Defluviitaleaceae bacterium]